MDASHLFVLLKRKLCLNRLYYKLYGLDYGSYVDSYFTQLLCIFYRAILCTARTVLSRPTSVIQDGAIVTMQCE